MKPFDPDAVPPPTADQLRERTERANCPACIGKRCHTAEEYKNHPMRGHGCSDGKWSKPELKPTAK
jgi:hypothetical protein